ncbi:MAG: PepSY-associated TM helix domain-containing protein [Methylococcales bacterium]
MLKEYQQPFKPSNSKRIFSRKKIRELWLNVHLTLAMTIGFILVILGLTGSVNVFYFELEELWLPKVRMVNDARPRPLNEIMQTVKAAYPQRQKAWNLHFPAYNRDYLWVEYPKPEESFAKFFAPLEILVDPYTGKIVKEQFWGQTLWSQIYDLHVDLLTDKINANVAEVTFKIVSFLGIFFLISALSGLYLWWPRWAKFKQAVTFKQNASFQRFNFDLHKTTGFYSSIILLILAFTGFAFGYGDYIKSLVGCFSSVKAEQFKTPTMAKKSELTGRYEPISVEKAVAIADQIFPNAQLLWLSTPDSKEGVYVIEKRQPGEVNHRRPRSKVWIDQYSGKVLAVENPNQFTAGETFLNLLRPLHSGEAFGFVGRILWCLVGFAPLVLYVTGILRWLQKRRAAKFKKL